MLGIGIGPAFRLSGLGAGGTPPTPFDFDQLPGLADWMSVRTSSSVLHDGATAIDNDTVSDWVSLNGTLSYSQGDTGSRPVLKTNIQNGLPVVRIGGNNCGLLGDTAIKSVSANVPGITMFFAGGWTDFNAGDDVNTLWQEWVGGWAAQRTVIFTTKTTDPEAFLFVGARRLDGEATDQIQSAEYVPTGFAIWTVRIDFQAATISVRRNGVYVIPETTVTGMSTGNTSNTACNDVNLGVPSNEGSNFDLSEFIRCTQALTETDIIKAENKLSELYAVDFKRAPIITNPGDFTLTFEDTFSSGSAPDSSKWIQTYEGGRRTTPTNGELQYYQDANATISGGILTLQGRAETITPTDPGYEYEFDYTSGMICSYGKFTQQYGYFEIRCKFPDGPGTWPAFWLFNPDPYWEIDIFENFGDNNKRIYGTMYAPPGDASVAQGFYSNGVNLTQDYHTIGLDWTADYVAFYFDGFEFYRMTATESIPDMPLYLIANLAIGSHASAPTEDTVLPANYEIDYIRAYQRI